MTIHCYATKEQCNLKLAEDIVGISHSALRTRKFFSIVLSGGSTPQELYSLLAAPTWRERVDWTRAHIFFGDERCVPKDHPDSNYRAARSSLLKHLPVPPEQVHRIHGEVAAKDEARRYEERIHRVLALISPYDPLFDITLLGIGNDGHTASLFPGDAVLESNSLVTAVAAPAHMRPSVSRVSLTMQGIGKSQNICFLVQGEAKNSIVKEILAGENMSYPAAMVQQKTPSWYLAEMDCSLFSK